MLLVRRLLPLIPHLMHIDTERRAQVSPQARAAMNEEEGKPVTAVAPATVELPATAETLEEEGRPVIAGTLATVESPATAETLEEELKPVTSGTLTTREQTPATAETPDKKRRR
jgi:hypothetical protein